MPDPYSVTPEEFVERWVCPHDMPKCFPALMLDDLKHLLWEAGGKEKVRPVEGRKSGRTK